MRRRLAGRPCRILGSGVGTQVGCSQSQESMRRGGEGQSDRSSHSGIGKFTSPFFVTGAAGGVRMWQSGYITGNVGEPAMRTTQQKHAPASVRLPISGEKVEKGGNPRCSPAVASSRWRHAAGMVCEPGTPRHQDHPLYHQTCALGNAGRMDGRAIRRGSVYRHEQSVRPCMMVSSQHDSGRHARRYCRDAG